MEGGWGGGWGGGGKREVEMYKSIEERENRYISSIYSLPPYLSSNLPHQNSRRGDRNRPIPIPLPTVFTITTNNHLPNLLPLI